MSKLEELEKELASVINRHGLDKLTNTPDFVLAKFISTSIGALKAANEESKRLNLGIPEQPLPLRS